MPTEPVGTILLIGPCRHGRGIFSLVRLELPLQHDRILQQTKFETSNRRCLEPYAVCTQFLLCDYRKPKHEQIKPINRQVESTLPREVGWPDKNSVDIIHRKGMFGRKKTKMSNNNNNNLKFSCLNWDKNGRTEDKMCEL